MRYNYLLFFCLVISTLIAQDNSKLQEEVAMDLLRAPSSPGFILLDQQPTDIERPTDPTDLIVSFRNASDNFKALPSNYALEMAPFWLFGGKNISFQNFTDTSNHIGNTFKQSLTISTAFGVNDKTIPNQRQISAGIKFSLLRGKHISREFLRTNNERMEILRDLNDGIEKDPSVKRINKKYDSIIKKPGISDDELAAYIKEKSDSVNYYKDKFLEKTGAKYEAKLKKLAKVKLKRYGWFLDVAGGVLTGYKSNVWDSIYVPKFGIWSTFGYAGEKGCTFLLLVRDLYKEKDLYRVNDSMLRMGSLNHLDGGLRFLFEKNKFSVSLEALARYTSGPKDIKAANQLAWKSMLNLGYDLGENRILSFNVGRDFDGTVSKGGNLIAAVNLVIGLGSKRQL
jgi:hypothetical protein